MFVGLIIYGRYLQWANAKYSDVIILTWIVSAINKVFKKAIKSLENSIFFLFNIVYIRLRDLYGLNALWPFCELPRTLN